MPREHKYMFWTDLETTGSELKDNHIIEIGAAITDMQLNVLDGRSYVIPIPASYDMEAMKPVVVNMHTKNGLLDDLKKLHMITLLGDADHEISEWIRSFNGSNHMWLAGSGVMHFDRQYIKRDLPLTNDRLTYHAFDVGVLRRTFQMLLGYDEWPEDTKSHRAFDDVLFHIEEAKFALDKMRTGVLSFAPIKE